MIQEFFVWWLRQLRAFAAFGRAGHVLPDAVVVAVDQFGVLEGGTVGRISVRRNGQESALATLDFAHPPSAPRLPVHLRLPAGHVLHRDVSLPLAVARDLPTAVGFEMDRLTPFTVDQVIWSTAGLRRYPASAELRFTLLMVLRQPVEALAAALSRIDLYPAFVECAAGRIALRANRPGDRKRAAAWALCGVLALACVVTPVIKQQLALQTAARQLAALEPVRAEAMALNRSLAASAAGAAAIAAGTQRLDPLPALAALTNALPDDTWLSDLTLNQGELTFDGQSANAAKLIAILAGSRHFADPRFTAPVTRATNGGADLFSIQAKMLP